MYSSANNGYFDHTGRYVWSAHPAAAPETTTSAPSHPQRSETTRSHYFEERNVVFSSHQEKGAEAYGLPINRNAAPTLSCVPTLYHCIPTPPPPSPFDLYKDDAYRSFEAAIQANKKYVQKEKEAKRATHKSGEGVEKNAKLANVCAQFIEKRFPNHQPGGEGYISLSDRIMHTLERLFCECEVAYGALLLLQRVYECRGGRYSPESSQFELFLSAYMLSHKFLEDENYENETWITVSLKLFTGDQIKKMQVTMINFLNWDVAFTGEQLADWMKKISVEFSHNI